MDLRYFAEHRVGRLVEARLGRVQSVDDVADFERILARAFASAGARAVICADWRDATVLPPAVADRLVGLLAKGSAHLERSAVLLAKDHATFNLQVERVVREAHNPHRRTFRSTQELESWLGEVLGEAEKIRVRTFLGGHAAWSAST